MSITDEQGERYLIKIKEGFTLWEVLDVNLVIGEESGAYMPNRMMSVNETGTLLWKSLEEGAEREELVAKVLEEYDTDEETAARDVDSFLAALREKELIEEC